MVSLVKFHLSAYVLGRNRTIFLIFTSPRGPEGTFGDIRSGVTSGKGFSILSPPTRGCGGVPYPGVTYMKGIGTESVSNRTRVTETGEVHSFSSGLKLR